MPGELLLYVDYMSQPARAVLQLVKYERLPVQERLVNIGKGEVQREPYTQISALRKVPSLQEGDWVLHESGAILCYLAARFGRADWYPGDARRRAEVDAVLHWHHSNIRAPCFAMVFNRWLAPRFQQAADPAAGDQGEAALGRSLKALQRVWLASTPFLTGTRITLADLQVCAELEGLRVLLGPDLAASPIFRPFPAVSAWMQRVASHLGPVHADCNKVLDKVVSKQARPQQPQAAPKL